MGVLCKRKHKKVFFAVKFILVMGIIFYSVLTCYSKYMLPQAIKISKSYTTTYINKLIDEAVEETVKNNNLTTQDFFVQAVGEDNRLTSMIVNSLLINEVCGKVSYKVSEGLNNIENKPINLPFGSITGINILNNKGPAVKVYIHNNGSGLADYDTSFNSVGINQINFQVWINVQSDVNIILPMNKQNFIVNRKIMLVNTVFNGEVPMAYLNNDNKNIEK